MSHGEVYSKPTDAADYVCMETYERVVRERDEARRALENAVRDGYFEPEYGWDKPEKWLRRAAAELEQEKKAVAMGPEDREVEYLPSAPVRELVAAARKVLVKVPLAQFPRPDEVEAMTALESRVAAVEEALKG